MIAVSKQGPRPALQPRYVAPEQTPDERRETRRQSIREAIHADLHRLYDRYAAEEYKGPLNTDDGVPGIIPAARTSLGSPGSGYSRALGVELHRDFISYLDQDHLQENLWKALQSLKEDRPNLYQIIWAHLKDDLTDRQLGETFHLDRETAGARMDKGLDVIAGKLGAWRN